MAPRYAADGMNCVPNTESVVTTIRSSHGSEPDDVIEVEEVVEFDIGYGATTDDTLFDVIGSGSPLHVQIATRRTRFEFCFAHDGPEIKRQQNESCGHRAVAGAKEALTTVVAVNNQRGAEIHDSNESTTFCTVLTNWFPQRTALVDLLRVNRVESAEP